MDGFVDRLHALRFLRACDPSYGALTFTLVGLPPTGYISLLLDILSGSFLPSLGRQPKSTRVEGADTVMQSCEITRVDAFMRRGVRLADTKSLCQPYHFCQYQAERAPSSLPMPSGAVR